MVTKAKYQERFLKQKKPEVAVTFGAFNEDDPRSLINLVPDKLRGYIARAIDPTVGGDLRFISWSERKLENQLKKALPEATDDPSRRLDAKDHMLRANFWGEYYRAQDTKTKMIEQNIIRNITYHEDFYRRLSLPLYMAWMLSAPTNLAVSQAELLMHAMRTLRNVVTNVDAIWDVKETFETDQTTGEQKRTRHKKLNTRAVTEIRKITEEMANRYQGAIVHRHQILQTQLPAKQNPTQKAIPQAESREDLEREIEALEAEIEHEGSTQVVEGEIGQEKP